MKTLNIIIDALPIQWNDYLGTGLRGRLRKKKKEKELFYWLLKNYLNNYQKKYGEVPRFEKYKVKFTFILPDAKKDTDGICVKYIIDLLIKLGILAGDKVRNNLFYSVTPEIIKGKEQTTIEIEGE